MVKNILELFQSPELQYEEAPQYILVKIQAIEDKGKSLFKTTREEKMDCLSVQFSSVTQLCPTLYDPMNRSTPGLPIHHQLLEFTQTRAHRVSDAIQPSHPLLAPSPPAPSPSQHEGLFQ